MPWKRLANGVVVDGRQTVGAGSKEGAGIALLFFEAHSAKKDYKSRAALPLTVRQHSTH